MGCILAGVAGIMVFTSIDELLPRGPRYGEAISPSTAWWPAWP